MVGACSTHRRHESTDFILKMWREEEATSEIYAWKEMRCRDVGWIYLVKLLWTQCSNFGSMDWLSDYWHLKNDCSPWSKVLLLFSLMKATLLQKIDTEMHSVKMSVDLLLFTRKDPILWSFRHWLRTIIGTENLVYYYISLCPQGEFWYILDSLAVISNCTCVRQKCLISW